MDEESNRGVRAWLREHFSVVIGIIGLLAWFAMLWFMFGDVL